MRIWRFIIIGIACAAIIAGATLVAPAVQGQVFVRQSPPGKIRTLIVGEGSHIGVTLRDVDSESAAKERRGDTGVVIEDVRKDGPAAKAGVRSGDVIVEFDGERVRSARQFARLVQETPAGRSVRTVVQRDGQRVDVTIVPETERDVLTDRSFEDQMTKLGKLGERFRFDLEPRDFTFSLPYGMGSPTGRLGVEVVDLNSQLATYFGVKNGVLVKSVSENTPASRAGIRAGDVITAVGGNNIDTAIELRRELNRPSEGQEIALSVVRDKKDVAVKVKLEDTRRRPVSRRTV